MSASDFYRVVWVLPLVTGCYLAHERALPSDGACVGPGIGGDACGAMSTPLAEGVCRMRDGQVIAFAGRRFLASCGPSAGDPRALELVANGCSGEAPFRQALECPGLPAAGPIRVGRRSVDPPPGECALVIEEEAAGPYEPFDAASEVCVELPTWCGAPVVIELVVPDADPCAGAATAERCRAFVDGSRIVVEAETAPALMDGCEFVLGDRVARCVVPPLGVGSYEIATRDGRLLDVIEVGPFDWPSHDVERRCTPITR